MTPQTTPARLTLHRDARLEIDFKDGHHCEFTVSYLRTMCPCASCRMVRDGNDPHDISPGIKRKPLLTILPGNFAEAITVTNAEMVGNYAIKLVFSDGHDTGIYSFVYLREICPEKKEPQMNTDEHR